MSEIKHTPGPWRIRKAADDDGFYIRGTNETGANMPLAITRHGPQKANAALIAAAPDLLAQLKSLAVQVEAVGLIVPPHVKSAIARAEGKDSV